MLTYKIDGIESLNKKIKELKNETRKKGGRFALRKAANVIKTQAEENAKKIDDPQSKEEISKNIAIRWNGRLNKRTGNLGFRVGVLGGAIAPAIASGEIKGKGKKNPGGDTYYWRFLEFGTQKMKPLPFMRKALSENIEKATNEFVKHYDKAIDRAIKRGKK